jgi:hypothetical protein
MGTFHNVGAAVIKGVDWGNIYDPYATTYNVLPDAVSPNLWTLNGNQVLRNSVCEKSIAKPI